MNQLVKMEKTACTSSVINGNGNGKTADSGLQISRRQSHHRYGKSTWFDTRVFYVRISNFAVPDGCIPERLTLNHVLVNTDTFLEINGSKCSKLSKGVLRRNRADSRNEEATFVSTDCIRFTGSVKFEVMYKEDVIISGILEMSNSNGVSEESKNNNNNNDIRRWSLNCDVVNSPGLEFLKEGKTGRGGSENISPTIEVYVAGCVSGSPIILTKTLRLKKNSTMRTLNSIPESDGGSQEPFEPGVLQSVPAGYRNVEAESEAYNNDVNWRDEEVEYTDGEYGELTWFAAGVRVGVGIGLGICLGVGIGVGVLFRSYSAATRSFRRQLL